MTEQAKVKNYGIDIRFDLWDEINLDFTWYLSKPKKQGQRATFDSFNEFMRESAFDFIENNPIYVIRESEVSDWESTKIVEQRKEITWSQMYNSCMQMIMDSLDWMIGRWEPMFVIKVDDNKLRKVKKKRKDRIDLINNIKEEIRDLDLELAKQQAIKEVKMEYLWQQPQPIQVQQPQAPMPQQETPLPPKRRRKKWRGAQTEMSNDDVRNLF